MSKIKFVDLSEYFDGEFRFGFLCSADGKGGWVFFMVDMAYDNWGSWEDFANDYNRNGEHSIFTLADFRTAFPPERLPQDEYAGLLEIASKFYKYGGYGFERDIKKWIEQHEARKPDLTPVVEFVKVVTVYYSNTSGALFMEDEMVNAFSNIMDWLRSQGVEV